MKKVLSIIFTSALLIPTLSFGQSSSGFGQAGSQWWRNGETEAHNIGQDFVSTEVINYATVEGDTVIDGHQAGIIRQVNYERSTHSGGQQTGTTFQTIPDDNLYFYATADTVFMYNNNFNRFTPLFVYNVNEGDTVCLPVFNSDLRPNPYAHGDTCFCIIIDSIRTVLYDTTYLTTYFEHSLVGNDTQNWGNFPIANWSGFMMPYVPSGSYARKIGNTFGPFLPVSVQQGILNKPTTDSFHYQENDGLRCYQDNNVAIHIQYNNAFGCLFDTTNTLGIHRTLPMDNLIQVFPNPASTTLHIQMKKTVSTTATVSLSDIFGREVYNNKLEKGLNSTDISVAKLPAGIYYLLVAVDGRRYSKTVVIRK